MTVTGIVRSSLIDFPGLVSCVLFTQGCNYDCFYCHNRQLIDRMSAAPDLDDVMGFLARRAGKLDGVVLTGGEPTLQPDLKDFIKEIRKLGYKVKLDSNGSAPGVIASVLAADLCDYFAVDYKAPQSRYREICGVAADAAAVLRTIRLLLDYGAAFEVRTTVIPQLKEHDLILMAQELPVVPRYTLNRYRKPEIYRVGDEYKILEKPFSAPQITSLAEKIRVWQPNAAV